MISRRAIGITNRIEMKIMLKYMRAQRQKILYEFLFYILYYI